MLRTLKASDLPKIFGSKDFEIKSDHEFSTLFYDSRRIHNPGDGVFFALKAERDGHKFIQDCFDRGVRTFIISQDLKKSKTQFPDANFILVSEPLKAVQILAEYRRNSLPEKPVIGITGSNGKTIVKEWLWNLLSFGFGVNKSPKSFNSQLGVAISVWNMDPKSDFEIIEAGISLPGEMERLQRMIKPSIGILTNLGSAHEEGFGSAKEKLSEKLLLFSDVKKLIFRGDQEYSPWVRNSGFEKELISWGSGGNDKYEVSWKQKNGGGAKIKINDEEFDFHYSDSGSLENICHCIVCGFELGLSSDQIKLGLEGISRVSLRMDLKKGISGCWIINDSYNLDINGFKLGVEALSNTSHTQDRSIIMTDLPGEKKPEGVYTRIAEFVNKAGLKNFVGIGPEMKDRQNLFQAEKKFFAESVDEFKRDIGFQFFEKETILVSGARKFELERLIPFLEERVHGTKMEINLDSISHNLNIFRQMAPSSQMMVMLKGSGYGGGLVELGKFLERMKVDYFGVAYADEGIELRRSGIQTPIMVMNTLREAMDLVLENQLEPEIFDWAGLRSVGEFQKKTGKNAAIHINIDTGMHRLGFNFAEILELGKFISSENIPVKSIFSHLSSADEANERDFTQNQIENFKERAQELTELMGTKVPLHICNTSGIINYPEGHLDMVRLGIGLYGEDPSWEIKNRLLPAVTLKTEISQVKKLKKGDSVGYSRKGKMKGDGNIATLPIGYADGFPRILGNGKGRVIIESKLYPVIGNVCMDMIMIDLGKDKYPTGTPVEIFGNEISLSEFAQMQKTIPYEILTQIGPRVKRIYVSNL